MTPKTIKLMDTKVHGTQMSHGEPRPLHWQQGQKKQCYFPHQFLLLALMSNKHECLLLLAILEVQAVCSALTTINQL